MQESSAYDVVFVYTKSVIWLGSRAAVEKVKVVPVPRATDIAEKQT